MVSKHSHTDPVNSLLWLKATVWLLLGCLSWPALADSFTASVDRSELTDQETFQLTLTYSPQVLMGSPDIDALTQDFDILSGPRRMNSFQSINGQSESKTEWTFLLLPKRRGDLTIPALTFKGQTTQPIALSVTEVPQSVQQQKDKEAFFDIKVSDQATYHVQGQILYVEKLYYRVNHQDANLTSLEVEDARVEELQEPKRYTTVVNGQRLGVYERRFAIFPEKAGTLVIPGQRFQALAMSRNFNSWSGRTSSLSAVSRPIELEIQPVPGNYPVSPWLPAEKLTLSETWSEEPDNWLAGNPITRTIRVEAVGLVASQIVLPDTALPTTIKQYPDQTRYDDHKSDRGITGVFTQPVALVPTESGQLTIPKLRIPWWNTRTNKLEYATLPERIITIKPQPGQAAAAPEASSANRTTPEASNTSTTAVSAPANGIWMLISALLLISNFITGYLLWRRTQTPQTTQDQTDASPTEARQWRLVRKACQQQTPAEIRQALIQWASTLDTQGKSQYTLAALREHVGADDAKLAMLMDRLDQSLFDTSDGHRFTAEDGQNLLALLEPWRKANTSQSAFTRASDALPDLYGAAR